MGERDADVLSRRADRHQEQALEAIASAELEGARRVRAVLLPGTPTIPVGLEAARRRGRATVVLSPTGSARQRWTAAWNPITDGPREDLTSLTYQSLASFEPLGDGDDGQTARNTGPTPRRTILHPPGRAVLAKLAAAGEVTLILDDCHHLIEVWGRLLEDVLSELPDAFVLGLTSTPSTALTPDEAQLAEQVLGRPVHEVSVPAAVRDGDLAPYAELAWLTRSTGHGAEADLYRTAQAVTEIAMAEHDSEGDRMRLLVLCDPGPGGGSAQIWDRLQHVLPRLRPSMATEDGGRLFADPRCRIVVSTPGLAEGAREASVTGVVDLTTSTSGRSVVRTRAPALHPDPARPDKVGVVWTVLRVGDERPDGRTDGRDAWDRFVHKQQRLYGVDETGAVVTGVGHVDPTFLPDAPPAAETLDAINAGMLARSLRRSAIREAWAVGTGYDDARLRVLHVRAGSGGPAGPAPVVLHDDALEIRDGRPTPWRPHVGVAGALVLMLVGYLLNLAPTVVTAIGLATVLGIQTTVAVDRGRRLAEELTVAPSIIQAAHAVADALHQAGISTVGADAVRVEPDPHGACRCRLDGVPEPVSATFATALQEVLGPLRTPRYVLQRWVLDAPVDNEDGLRAALGLLRPDRAVWHTVPSVLATHGERARVFARAWDHWVGGGPALYTAGPEGADVLAAHRDSDPFAVTTMLSTHWR